MYDVNWKIGGVGGMGAMGVGFMFSKTLFRSGYFIADYNEYNSIIKGGHNNYQVRISSEKIYCTSKKIDLLLALDEYSLSLYNDLSTENSFMICDFALVKNREGLDTARIIDVPFSMINKANGGDEIMKNIIGLGASFAILGIDLSLATEIVTSQFIKKGEDVVNKNLMLLNAGYAHVKEKYADQISSFQKVHGIFNKINKTSDENVVMTGNECIAVSAVASGLSYFAAYPMTPASSILHNLAPIANKYNFVVKHTEDEIAAINSAIGASWAGGRSMTATSGGGFSLMTEGLGLAAITETPLVAVVVSRPGPSTGMPTWTDQGDLRFVLHSSQGEFLRIVFSPGDPEECFQLTKMSFELSEKYHIPCLVLSDKYLAESHWSCHVINENNINKRFGFINSASLERIDNYERYADTVSGVTPRSIPGMKNGVHLANSDEHTAYGLTDESAEQRNIQLNKRTNKKLSRLIQELPKNMIYGDVQSKIGVICFGSMKNQMLETLKYLKSIKVLHLKYVAPFPTEEVLNFINTLDKFYVVENNVYGQLAGLITEYTGKFPNAKLLKDDGRPIFYEDVIEFIKNNGY